MKNLIKPFLVVFVFLLSACANFNQQISDDLALWNKQKSLISKEDYQVFLLGDAGATDKKTKLFSHLQKQLNQAPKNSTLLVLGDNIYPKGLSKKSSKDRKTDEARLDRQLDLVKNYKGRVIVIPGNHDWYHGLKGLKRQEDYIKKHNPKIEFIPSSGCPLDKVSFNETTDLIVVDSQWYLTDWDKHPTMNDECSEIKTRRKFFEELEGLINKSADKTTLIAIHHPLTSRGPHGGHYGLKGHLFPFGKNIPLPIIGSIVNLSRKLGGVNNQDTQNKNYQTLVNRISTLAQNSENIIFVSGHEHSLQYLTYKGKPQIISGSGSKTSPTLLGKNKGFTSGQQGFGVLHIKKDRNVNLRFYDAKEKIFETAVISKKQQKVENNYTDLTTSTKKASIYTTGQTYKSKFYKMIWGEHYRDLYSTRVEVPVAYLDTMFGGLTVIKKGGGHQSKSLRLVNPEGKQYVMRALKKSATRFLQTVAFQEDYVEKAYENTVTEDLLYDFYTAAHPYAPLTIDELSKPLGVLHAVPRLYYIPKQKRLTGFTDEFGDALYYVEERSASGHGDFYGFHYKDTIVSTDHLFKKLRKNEKHKLDENNYVRSRLFDMVLGDWDRHQDQWRWAKFVKNDTTYYQAVPRDRDQAFSNYDGPLLVSLTSMISAIKLMQTYKKEIRNLRNFNLEPFPIDLSLIQYSDYGIWERQAAFIKTHLTDEVIDKAFLNFPKEVQDFEMQRIKRILKYRRDHVMDIANEYHNLLEEFALIKGTDKKDVFKIYDKDGQLFIDSYRKKKEGLTLYKQRSFKPEKTKEIWIYGLDDEDVFEVNTNFKTKIRLIGGQNKDHYNIVNAPNAFVHDFKSKKSKIEGKQVKTYLSDIYNNNVYTFRKIKRISLTNTPVLGFNPDDGLFIGTAVNYTRFGFNSNPFSEKYKANVKYYNATQGFDISLNGQFATYHKNWFVNLEAHAASPNYSINFFGLGKH